MRKTLLIGIALIALVASVSFLSGGPAIAEAASQGALYPSSGTNNTGTGSVAWTSPGNITADDGAYASISTQSNGVENRVSIVKADGTVGSTNKATGGWGGSFAYTTYGGSTDKWGETWTAADINDTDFGVVLSMFVGGPLTSNYLKGTGYGFSIPDGAIIDGIVVEIDKAAVFDALAEAYDRRVDTMRITVFYTAATPASVTSDVVFFE